MTLDDLELTDNASVLRLPIPTPTVFTCVRWGAATVRHGRGATPEPYI